MRQLAGAKRPSWLTAGPPERVRLERRVTVSLYLTVCWITMALRKEYWLKQAIHRIAVFTVEG
ncbi:hypothetical protein NCCP2331_21310 [Sporosarcina sp. NCCP-2331]|nr:hypothetical protein NCCP2331_21310 [Sporosarcina sp. NCCP-2331]GLB57788.1 hypothetical protein NCCP2378_35800 [Sporosarcina sp. NCCP-2378]